MTNRDLPAGGAGIDTTRADDRGYEPSEVIRPTEARAIRRQRLARLARLLDGHQRRLGPLEARALRWSWLRLIAFVGAGLLSLLALIRLGLAASLLAGLIGFLIFLWVVRRHLRLEGAILRRRARAALLGEQLARSRLDWSGLPRARARVPVPGHPVERDFDLVGEQGLHRLLDSCATASGSQRLRHWLGQGMADPERLAERQGAVKELVGLQRLRERLALEGRLVLGDAQVYRAERMDDFLALPFDARSLRRWTLLLSAMALTNLGLYLWQLQSGGPRWWLASFGLYALISLALQPRVMPAFAVATGLADGLAQLRAVLGLIEGQDLSGRPRLAARCAAVQASEHRPSEALRAMRRLTGGAAIRGNFFVWLPLNALLPWDVAVGWRLARHRDRLEHDLPAWLEVWHELEALACLANLAWLNPRYGFPRIARDLEGPLLSATGLGHPLLPERAKVANDLVVESLGEIHLVTGSNMAGKSTWLRTVGINLCLAYAGGPVDAARLEAIPLRIFGCTRVNDSVTDGISYFYAEVKRLRALLDALESEDPRPLAWFVDEIFRGTNNRERLIGSRALIRALAQGRGFGMISTHDLELAGLAEEIDGLRNFHFREQIEGQRMAFDYALREGPCPTTNALRLMAGAGLPVDPESRA